MNIKTKAMLGRTTCPNTLAGRLRIVCGARVLLLLVAAQAMAVQAQFIYTIENGAVTITGYTDPYTTEALIIPQTIGGLPVMNIGDGAFDSQYYLPSITIPAGVTNIGSAAFNECQSLASVTIPNSVTSIGRYAFYDCASLSNVNVPEGVTR